MSRKHGVIVCRHCLGCSDVIDDCDFCAQTGALLCDTCGEVTGFAATIHSDSGEELCSACFALYEQDAA